MRPALTPSVKLLPLIATEHCSQAGTTPYPEDYARVEEQVAALTKEDLTRDEALSLLMAVSRYTVGWVLEEQAFRDRGEMAGVPQVMIDLHQGDTSASFDFGLQALLAGALMKRFLRQRVR